MQTISLPVLEAGEYAGGIWYYEPHTYQSYRYVLGRVGKHPLVCIGINPSTAQPGALDPTLKSVERLAAAKVRNVSLTNFDVIAQVAAEQKYIKPEDVARLLQFRNDPSDESWIGGTN